MASTTSSPARPAGNLVLGALPPAELEVLRPHLVRMRLVNGQTLQEPDQAIEHLFFVDQGFISLVIEARDLPGGVEVGLVGREGVVGLAAFLTASGLAFTRAMVQMAGSGSRLAVPVLRDALPRLPSLRRRLRRAVLLDQVQAMQTAACNSRHTLAQRCARWLLLARDRTETDELAITQEFLSIMLSVRRPGVTSALGELRERGLLRSSRGKVVIADRAGLEAAACGCYRRVRDFEAMSLGRGGAHGNDDDGVYFD
ncbi:MAG: Crp/Fnr family transcriptional regulator [Geminicoccaceae bacterium]